MQTQDYLILQFLFIGFLWPASKHTKMLILLSTVRSILMLLVMWVMVEVSKHRSSWFWTYLLVHNHLSTSPSHFLALCFRQAWLLGSSELLGLGESLVSVLEHWLCLSISSWLIPLASHGLVLRLVHMFCEHLLISLSQDFLFLLPAYSLSVTRQPEDNTTHCVCLPSGNKMPGFKSLFPDVCGWSCVLGSRLHFLLWFLICKMWRMVMMPLIWYIWSEMKHVGGLA